MTNKKSFVLRIDPEKLEAVEKWAADEFRSTNGQLEWIIDQALKKGGRYKVKLVKESDETSNQDEKSNDKN